MKLIVKDVYNFEREFDEVINKVLPHISDGNNELYPLEQYKERLKGVLKYESNINEVGLPLIGKIVFQVVREDFHLLITLKRLFWSLYIQNHEMLTNLDMLIRAAKDNKYPMGKEWLDLTKYIKVALSPQFQIIITQATPSNSEGAKPN